jgi:hypothetical protein
MVKVTLRALMRLRPLVANANANANANAITNAT